MTCFLYAQPIVNAIVVVVFAMLLAQTALSALVSNNQKSNIHHPLSPPYNALTTLTSIRHAFLSCGLESRSFPWPEWPICGAPEKRSHFLSSSCLLNAPITIVFRRTFMTLAQTQTIVTREG